MSDKFSKVKGFGETLDHIFQLCKTHFSKFFLIFLILIGPVYLLEALFLLGSGTSFFRQVGSGSNVFDQVAATFDQSVESDLGIESLFQLIAIVLMTVAIASVLFAIQHIKRNEEFTAGSVIKKAFKRFGALLGSNIIVGLIGIGIFIGLVIALVMGIFIGAYGNIDSVLGVFIIMLIIILGITLGFALLFTRWGFFIAAVTFKEGFPGLAQSWRLTKKHTWRTLGLFAVIYLITRIVGVAIESVFVIFLGESVLYTLIIDLVTILIAVINAVAYSVIYFDLKLRRDGDDLQEMIDDYQKN